MTKQRPEARPKAPPGVLTLDQLQRAYVLRLTGMSYEKIAQSIEVTVKPDTLRRRILLAYSDDPRIYQYQTSPAPKATVNEIYLKALQASGGSFENLRFKSTPGIKSTPVRQVQ